MARRRTGTKKMRVSFKYKLFISMVLTTFVVVASMYFFMQWSFNRGFLNYANAQDLKRIGALGKSLENVYKNKTNGGWEALWDNNDSLWNQLLAINESISNQAELATGVGGVVKGARGWAWWFRYQKLHGSPTGQAQATGYDCRQQNCQ